MRRRTFWALLAIVIGIGALLRLYRLDAIPGGLHFDEAANLFDILDLANGDRPIFFPANRGREPLFIYAQFLMSQWLGPTMLALRVTGAAFGILTLPAMAFVAYQLVRALLGEPFGRRAALVATALLVGTFWHLHFSRFGLRTISLPLFECLAIGLLWQGIQRRRAWPWALAGLNLGIAGYTYLAARFLPPLFALPGVLLAFRRDWQSLWRTALGSVVATLTALPLLGYFVEHPDDFFGRAGDISLLDPANRHQSLPVALQESTIKTLLMFVWEGSRTPAENLPGRPWFDPIAGGAFVIGVLVLGVIVVRPRSARRVGIAVGENSVDRVGKLATAKDAADQTSTRISALFLLAWLGVMLLPSILTVHTPAHLRLSGAVAPSVIVATLGLLAVTDGLRRLVAATGRSTSTQGRIANLALTGLVAGSVILTTRDYFLVWAASDVAFYGVMGEKVATAEYVATWLDEGPVFLAPLYAQDTTIRFLTRNRPPATFDAGTSVVVPTRGSGTVRYVFPIFDHEQPAAVRGLLPVPAEDAIVYDASGRRPVVRVLTIDSNRLPERPEQDLARFGEAVALVDLQLEFDAPARPGDTIAFVATWLANRQTPRPLTIFWHLRDAEHHTVAQNDSQPSGGRYPTDRWREGDLVVERYRLTIPEETTPGAYRLIVGVYDQTTMEREPVRATDGTDVGSELEVAQIPVASFETSARQSR